MLLKLRALLLRFKANGVLRNKQEEAAAELPATAITLAAAAMVGLVRFCGGLDSTLNISDQSVSQFVGFLFASGLH